MNIGYLLDVGVLLQPCDKEYGCYNTVYGKQFSFYDENQSMFKENELEKAIDEAKQYVTNGICNTYAVITEQPVYTDVVEDCYYEKDAIVFCCFKDINGAVVEGFIK